MVTNIGEQLSSWAKLCEVVIKHTQDDTTARAKFFVRLTIVNWRMLAYSPKWVDSLNLDFGQNNKMNCFWLLKLASRLGDLETA